jgi:hypothetical protein
MAMSCVAAENPTSTANMAIVPRQRDQAEEADHFEREACGAEPGRERVENQVIRQAGRKPQRDHDERRALHVDAERRDEGCGAGAGIVFLPTIMPSRRRCTSSGS